MMRLWIEPVAFDEITALPGHIRQRIRRAVNDLHNAPRPTYSRALEIPADVQIEGLEARRLRIDSWRVLYVIDEEWEIITVLAVRKRPPYNYDDLRDLLGRV
jgi:mRNA-degrading endonuclease RelE of RelBE toxin-antitoxin system